MALEKPGSTRGGQEDGHGFGEWEGKWIQGYPGL